MAHETKHTPAPWSFVKRAGDYEIEKERPYSLITRLEQQQFYAETEANAQLIAAAPELLEALEYALELVQRCAGNLEDDGEEQDHVYANVINPARVAIAKAKGISYDEF